MAGEGGLNNQVTKRPRWLAHGHLGRLAAKGRRRRKGKTGGILGDSGKSRLEGGELSNYQIEDYQIAEAGLAGWWCGVGHSDRVG
jgi:hypothetical protein